VAIWPERRPDAIMGEHQRDRRIELPEAAQHPVLAHRRVVTRDPHGGEAPALGTAFQLVTYIVINFSEFSKPLADKPGFEPVPSHQRIALGKMI